MVFECYVKSVLVLIGFILVNWFFVFWDLIICFVFVLIVLVVNFIGLFSCFFDYSYLVYVGWILDFLMLSIFGVY